MSVLLDVMVVVILLLFVFIGYKRGFVKTIVQLVGSIVALVLAFVLSGPIAGGIYDGFISGPARDALSSQITIADEDNLLDSARQQLQNLPELLDGLPSIVTNALEKNNLSDPEAVLGRIESGLLTSKEQLVENVEQTIIRPVAVAMLRPFVILVLFIVLMIVILILANLLNKLLQFPGLKQINQVLGALTGVVQGAVIVLIGVTVLSFVSFSVDTDSAVSRGNIDKTFIVRGIESINPLNKPLSDLGLAVGWNS